MAKSNILVLSDLHHGSIYGMMPPDFQTSDDRIQMQNPGQRYLWKCWTHLPVRLKGTKIDAIVVNGDPLDGRQEAQRGTELGVSMVFDHQEATRISLQYLMDELKCQVIYFVQGTEYHDGKGGELVEHVAQMLGAQKYRGLGTGKWSHEVLDLDVDGVIINFAHAIGVGVNPATPAGREALLAEVASLVKKLPRANCIVRSHVHNFIHVERAFHHVVVTPCWQLQTRFMRKNGPYRMLPDLGATLITVDPNAAKIGDDPISIRKLMYELPEIQATRLVHQ